MLAQGRRAGRLARRARRGQRYYDQAAELADDPLVAGRAARAGRPARDPGEPPGRGAGAARAGDRALRRGGRGASSRPGHGRARRRGCRGGTAGGGGRPARAGRSRARAGEAECRARGGARPARPHASRSPATARRPSHRSSGRSTLAERLQLPEVFVEALTSKGVVLLAARPAGEARILLEAATARAHDEQLYASALRARTTSASCSRPPTATPRRSDLGSARSHWPAGAATAAGKSTLRDGHYRTFLCSAAGTRRSRIAAEEEPERRTRPRESQLLWSALIHCERGDLEAARGSACGGRGPARERQPADEGRPRTRRGARASRARTAGRGARGAQSEGSRRSAS